MDKDPTITSFILEWMNAHTPAIYAFLMSICIAVLRVVYSGGGLRNMFLEVENANLLLCMVFGSSLVKPHERLRSVLVGILLGSIEDKTEG